MSLTSKIAGLAISLVVATTIIFGLLVQRAAENAITAREGDRLIYGVSDVAQKLHEEIDKAVDDAKVAAATAAVQAPITSRRRCAGPTATAAVGLVRSIQNGGIDPIDGVTTAEWRQRIADNFKAILSSGKSYLSVELLGVGDDGREIVKVNKTKDGKIGVGTDGIKQPGDRVLFQNAIRQPAGTPYISDIMPQDGGGPLVIDVAAPVLTLRGERFGVLKISVDCSRLIARLAGFNDAVSKLYMTTLDGRYIINPDATRPLTGHWQHRGRYPGRYALACPRICERSRRGKRQGRRGKREAAGERGAAAGRDAPPRGCRLSGGQILQGQRPRRTHAVRFRGLGCLQTYLGHPRRDQHPFADRLGPRLSALPCRHRAGADPFQRARGLASWRGASCGRSRD